MARPAQTATPSSVCLSLAGRTALVTGGSRGIGAATVRLFRAAGARVAFSYNTAQERAESLARELAGNDTAEPHANGRAAEQLEEKLGVRGVPTNQQCVAIRQPLGSAAEGRALVEAAVASLGQLDILVVNHGVWPAHDQPIATMPDAQWSSTMGINLDSVFGLVQAATAHMLAREVSEDKAPRGHIVLVASTAAQRGEAFHADYAASKGALLSLTKSLSSELAPQGILVNCVAPGWVATEMSAAALGDPAVQARAIAPIPLARVGHANEIAGPILFLCTPLAGFISGEIFNINGGAVLVG